jgi:pyridoxamine 5'-phosphate oxidase
MLAAMTPDPIALFAEWQEAARGAESHDPTAMALATTDATGNPSVRMVLLKQADARGFVFYTNLESPKSNHLRRLPRAALCLHWPALERQVRIEGRVEPVSAEEADRYFASRPRLSQLGAWASKQSRPLAGSFELEAAVAAVALRYPLGPVPRPPHWSGWRVVPDRIEFWQQYAFRLHDRQSYALENGQWTVSRLFP